MIDRSYTTFLVVMFVFTGSLNTLIAKFTDNLKDTDGSQFCHPILQGISLFIGEMLCFIPFVASRIITRYRNRRNGNLEEEKVLRCSPFVFAFPSFCDVVSSSLMGIGLILTNASSYQMLRGAVIIFTGLLAVGMLGQKIDPYKWFGMFTVLAGLVIVGLASVIYDNNPDDDRNAIITGNLLIVMSTIIVAVQLVYEQNFVVKYDIPPLLVVGLEGLFGFIWLVIVVIPMYFVYVPRPFSTIPSGRLEDPFHAWQQVYENPWIGYTMLINAFSIAFYAFAGVSVTKQLSATSRMVLDSLRTAVIWAVSIPLFGEQFIAFQLLGFILLISGMLIYNDLLFRPLMRRYANEASCCGRFLLRIAGRACSDDDEITNLINNDQA